MRGSSPQSWPDGPARAFLTPFYTRLICLTFWQDPIPIAEHAHETPANMTVPLVILAVFALGAGWFAQPSRPGSRRGMPSSMRPIPLRQA